MRRTLINNTATISAASIQSIAEMPGEVNSFTLAVLFHYQVLAMSDMTDAI